MTTRPFNHSKRQEAALPTTHFDRVAIRFVTIERYAEISGYTAKAIRRKMEEGVWIEGRQYRRAPDGRILIDIEGVDAWAAGQPEPSNSSKGRSGSSSRSTARAA